MLKAFIVDDEPLARDELIYLLKKSRKVDIVGEADHMEAVLNEFPETDADVIFLDIQLGDENGLDIAKQLNKMENKPNIVFATAYDEFALEAFELSAFDYILKPFDESRVNQTIEKLYKGNRRNNVTARIKGLEKVLVNLEDRIVLLQTDDILFITSLDGKTIITAKQGQYETAESLVSFERKLQNKNLIRVHRSYLVNIDRIKEIQPWFNSTYNLIMEDRTSVPVSRTYTKELKQRIGL